MCLYMCIDMHEDAASSVMPLPDLAFNGLPKKAREPLDPIKDSPLQTLELQIAQDRSYSSSFSLR